MGRIARLIQDLDTAHFEMRDNCVQNRLYHFYNSKMVRFNAYYYATREFALNFVRLVRIVQSYSNR